MHGASLRWARYQPPSPDWDHDHCALCFAKFMDADGDDILREGYLIQPHGPTTDVAPEEERTTYADGYRIVAAPNNDHWICPTCFADFREYFDWTETTRPGTA